MYNVCLPCKLFDLSVVTDKSVSITPEYRKKGWILYIISLMFYINIQSILHTVQIDECLKEGCVMFRLWSKRKSVEQIEII